MLSTRPAGMPHVGTQVPDAQGGGGRQPSTQQPHPAAMEEKNPHGNRVQPRLWGSSQFREEKGNLISKRAHSL